MDCFALVVLGAGKSWRRGFQAIKRVIRSGDGIAQALGHLIAGEDINLENTTGWNGNSCKDVCCLPVWCRASPCFKTCCRTS